MAATNDIEPVLTRPSRLSALFINRNFALLFAGQSISTLGDEVFSMTLIVWVALQIAVGQSWAPLATSGLVIVGTVPILLIGPLAGVFADRWSPRQTMLWMDLLRAGIIASLLVLTLQKTMTPLGKLLFIYIAMFLESACAQFFNPSRLSLLSDLVPETKRARATGTEQTAQSLAAILGPPLAAPLLFAAGPQWAILLDALTFVCSFWAIAAIKLAPNLQARPAVAVHEPRSVRAEFMQGLRFAFGNAVIRALIITFFLVTLGIGSFAPLLVFFVAHNLAVPATYTGVLLSAFGAGAVLGAILFSMLAQRIGIKRLFVLSVTVAGCLIVLLSRLNTFLFAIAVVLFIGMMQAALNVATFPIVLSETPRGLIGRVAAVLTPIATVGSLISVSCAGYVAGIVLAQLHLQVLGLTFGPVDTVLTASGLLLVAGGLFAGYAFFQADQQKSKKRSEQKEVSHGIIR